MHIVCPHCTTSYAIDLATLGGTGRTVRCSRCKEVWLARPEDAIELAGGGAGNGGSRRAGTPRPPNADADGGAEGSRTTRTEDTPVVDSPSISGDWPAAVTPKARRGRRLPTWPRRRSRMRGGTAAAAQLAAQPF